MHRAADPADIQNAHLRFITNLAIRGLCASMCCHIVYLSLNILSFRHPSLPRQIRQSSFLSLPNLLHQHLVRGMLSTPDEDGATTNSK